MTSRGTSTTVVTGVRHTAADPCETQNKRPQRSLLIPKVAAWRTFRATFKLARGMRAAGDVKHSRVLVKRGCNPHWGNDHASSRTLRQTPTITHESGGSAQSRIINPRSRTDRSPGAFDTPRTYLLALEKCRALGFLLHVQLPSACIQDFLDRLPTTED